ncbi:hypothetical protein AYO40_03540 [Planctomycetaceae bacterium SCGC AG-212-D15]|nr:hypothetical protein AYO40_03540 [Planctomycetaceae bacterium SCGC AG-212-D15]
MRRQNFTTEKETDLSYDRRTKALIRSWRCEATQEIIDSFCAMIVVTVCVVVMAGLTLYGVLCDTVRVYEESR